MERLTDPKTLVPGAKYIIMAPYGPIVGVLASPPGELLTFRALGGVVVQVIFGPDTSIFPHDLRSFDRLANPPTS